MMVPYHYWWKALWEKRGVAILLHGITLERHGKVMILGDRNWRDSRKNHV